jgi:hypothetical protein
MTAAQLEARIDAHFDAVMEIARRIQSQMVADGLLRDPGARTRAGEQL